jgi:diketogulonate reductase-like aldo/keto reductase
VISHQGVMAIPKAASLECGENAAALDITLTAQELRSWSVHSRHRLIKRHVV